MPWTIYSAVWTDAVSPRVLKEPVLNLVTLLLLGISSLSGQPKACDSIDLMARFGRSGRAPAYRCKFSVTT